MLALWVQGSAISTQAQADAVLARVSRGKFTTVFQYTACATAMYQNSAHLPPAYPGEFDPIRYILPRYHELGINVHAWLCPGWCTQHPTFRATHPGWTCTDNGAPLDLSTIPAHWLCFDVPEAREFWVSVALECKSLGFDGIHWDYIRYDNGWDEETQRAEYYPPAYFGRDSVTYLVEAAREALRHAQDKALDCTHSAAVLSGVLSACPDMLQWWDEWIDLDLIDVAIPMLYHYTGDESRMAEQVTQWISIPPEYITPGLRVETDWNESSRRLKTPLELQAQLDVCSGYNGYCFFDESALHSDGGTLLDYIATLAQDEENMTILDDVRELVRLVQQLQFTTGTLVDECRAVVDQAALVEAELIELDEQLDVLGDVIELD